MSQIIRIKATAQQNYAKVIKCIDFLKVAKVIITCIQASWPLIAAMWAAVQPLKVTCAISAPCQRSQWRH